MSERVWMATAKLRAYARSGRTLEEIAELNAVDTGWKPERSTVSKKLLAIGEEPRYGRRTDLVPWRIAPKHIESRFRYMLEAESRRRTGKTLRPADKKAADLLNDLLFGRGTPLVVGYCHEHGFYLTDRSDEDQDIIRAPREAGSNGAPVEVDQ